MRNLQKKILSTDIAVIGAGPVGLTAALFLEKFGLSYTLFERQPVLRNHPSAHWINVRSKQILSEIDGLVPALQSKQESWQYFSHYLYVERILGRVLGRDNHFAPNVEAKLAALKLKSEARPSHLNQSLFCQVLYDHLQSKDSVRFGHSITKVLRDSAGQVVLGSEDGSTEIHAKFVIACDGFHSSIRRQLGIQLQGQPELLKFINVHFTSPNLAKLITQSQQDAMLHFIYNQDFPAVLVNHTKQTGVFVLQIPNYEPFYDLLQNHTPQQLVTKILDSQRSRSLVLKDLKIVHCGKWKLASQIADTYYSKGEGIALAGDSAHSFPPAGGFGMNTGIQDIHNLVHRIRALHKNPNLSHSKQLLNYSTERRQIGQKFMDIANKGFQKSLAISKSMGLDPQYMHLASKLSFLPFRNVLHPLGVKILFRPKPVNQHIALFYDQQLQYPRLSRHRAQISKGEFGEGSYFIASGCQPREFPELEGIRSQQIVSFDTAFGQRLVRSDGVLCH